MSKNSEYIAVEINGNIDFYDEKGELLHSLSGDEINTEEYTSVQLEQWNDDGDTLWCSLMETYVTVAYIAIDTKTWEPIKYKGFEFASEEYVLNPNTGWIVFSDYPVMLDTIAFDEYMGSKEMTTLAMYNLMTKEERAIATLETNKFNPKWSSDNEILYYTGYKSNVYQLITS